MSQLSFFVPAPSDIRAKQVRDLMSRSWFSLSKNRTTMIEHRTEDAFIRVRPAAGLGVPTIWDQDILLFGIAKKMQERNQLAKAGEAFNELDGWVYFKGPDFWDFTGRRNTARKNAVGGREYDLLRDSLRRLAGAMVETSIRAPEQPKRRRTEEDEYFHWVERGKARWEDGQHLGYQMKLADWIMQPIRQNRPDVLSLNPAYFKLTKGIERWLYLYARRAAGMQEHGWAEDAKLIYAKSAIEAPFRSFWHRTLRLLEANGSKILEYDVTVEQRGRTKALRFTRSPYMPKELHPVTIEHGPVGAS